MKNTTNALNQKNTEFDESPTQTASAFHEKWKNYNIIRRDGSVVRFDPKKIGVAISKTFLAISGEHYVISTHMRELIEKLTKQIVAALMRNNQNGGTFHIEDVQDQVELALMQSSQYDVARAYVLYREKRAQARAINIENKERKQNMVDELVLNVTDGNIKHPLDLNKLLKTIESACIDLNLDTEDAKNILKETVKNLYDGIPFSEVFKSAILSARSKIENDPAYSQVAARLLLHIIRKEVLGQEILQSEMKNRYVEHFSKFIDLGIQEKLLDPELKNFNLNKIANKLDANRDLQFDYLGLQTLYDRYFLHIKGQRIELPQIFFMRVAMGLAIKEKKDREIYAIKFYDVLSSFNFMNSTPTLFNSGTLHPQLSSCYLTTVPDELSGIYDAIKENALLAKYAGGLGNDWTPVRALHSYIKGTNGQSQGVVPFLKVVNDTAIAVNQGGKRKGAVCTYLETWHLDIEEFLELRKNTGDERRRTHDMNTANWIPDLFMKRVIENSEWTLFSPSDCPDLHDKYGIDFEKSYINYESKIDNGEITLFKKIPALSLWRKMLSMLFETGHPWITFKDSCNIRSPQQHIGIVHSSNLCTEITLNTNKFEIAVCNLGSINLVNHMMLTKQGYFLDIEKIRKTTKIAMRMLDNVIDINYYPVDKARDSNQLHRPIGIGIMGFQDCLHMMRIPYESYEAVEFSDYSMEIISYYAYLASNELAKERGCYESFNGSLWSRGILPLDTIQMLRNERGNYVEVDESSKLDWNSLRNSIKQYGMRNSNCVAIAPTATISNIVGVSACIEPTFQNLYVKSNLSGEFTIINKYLVRDLKNLGLWDAVMVSDLKYFDGSLARINRIPIELRKLYATAFEISPNWLVECASRRQKWIDQSQSLNIYMIGKSGKILDDIYQLAWRRGLKTTYYLRTLGATSAEKSTGQGGELNSVNSNENVISNIPKNNSILSESLTHERIYTIDERSNNFNFEDCETCQ